MTTCRRLIPVALAVFAGCSAITLERVDFGWPVESVLTVSPANTIEDVRYAVRANVAPVAGEEFQDSSALKGAKLRLIRSAEGYYFLTGPRFRHVFVFAPGPSSLVLHTAILVAEGGLKSPALNQRPPYVELIDGDSFRRLLTSDDIAEVKR